jgi:hypothetical protein
VALCAAVDLPALFLETGQTRARRVHPCGQNRYRRPEERLRLIQSTGARLPVRDAAWAATGGLISADLGLLSLASRQPSKSPLLARVLLSGFLLELETDEPLVAEDLRIVARLDHIGLAGPKL